MLHKWMEELVDFRLYLGLMFGLLVFFLCYWKNCYQTRQAELMLNSFLHKASSSGKITAQEHEKLVKNLEKMDADYELQITCKRMELVPVYGLISISELEQYYLSRNIRRKIEFQRYELQVEEEDVENMKLQTETNASILAAEQESIPLPEEGSIGITIEAVRNSQKVYEGEPLITLCRVKSGNEIYFEVADPVWAVSSGQYMLSLRVNGEEYYAPVEVDCYPRKINCSYGHSVVNSKEILEETNLSGTWECPYCKKLPLEMKCSTVFLSKTTGEFLGEDDLWLDVIYMDGHTERITPKEEEWQDDYDENFAGLQTVTIYYRGLKSKVTIFSENPKCRQCLDFCEKRNYLDYNLFPYCTDCMSREPFFTGEVQEEERCLEYKELAEILDKEGKVILKRGDYINLQLKQRGNYKCVLQKAVKQDGR